MAEKLGAAPDALLENRETETSPRRAELRSLLAISQTVTAMLPLPETLEHVVLGVRSGLRFDRVGIWLYDDQANLVRSVLGTDRSGKVVAFNHSEPVGDSDDRLAQVVRGDIPYFLTQDYQAESPAPHELMTDVQAHAIVPLRSGARIIGALTVDNLLTSRPITGEQVDLLQLFAGYAAVAIENSRLYQDAQDAAARERLINHLMTATRTSLNVDDIVALTMQELGRALDVDRCYVAFWDEATRTLRITPQHQYRAREDLYLIPKQVLPEPGNVVIETVCGKGEAMVVPDVTVLPPGPHHAVYRRTGTRAALYVPIKRQSVIVGILVLTQVGRVRSWTEEEQRIAQVVAEQLGIALENAFLFRRMQESEERLRKVIQSADLCIAIVDRQGKALLFNRGAERILGYTADEVVGKNLLELAYPAPADRVQPMGTFRASLESGQPVQGYETVVTAKDGTPRHIIFNMNLLRSLRGEIESVLYLGLDWTERRALEEQLRQAQKMESIGTLAGGVAHDFNNLLTGIIGYASLALNEMPLTDPHYAALSAIEQIAQRAANLTQQLLAVSRRSMAEMRAVNLNSVVEALFNLLRRTIPATVEMRLRLNATPLTVNGNEDQLGQMLMNLCVNARDAMPDGGVLEVETRCATLNEEDCRAILGATPGQYARLRVADSGVGMSEATLARIFDPFFTTKGVGKGTGLGLAMLYGIVKTHDGFIQVSSRLGQGTTVCIYLPLLEQPVVPEKEKELSAPQLGKETILFVDDEETVRTLAQNILRTLGYRVLLASNGSEGLTVYLEKQSAIDLVVTDLTMPQMNGRDLCDALRRLNPQVKIIISSGYNLSDDNQSLLRQDRVRILRKPYRIHEMARVVREALDS
jgi:PAS domain S-box-containing protein